MRADLDKALCEKYPLLYRDRNEHMNRTAMCWGFDFCDGWNNIVEELSAKLEAIISKIPIKEQEHFKASQVKEKFGSLRFYMSAQTEEMDALIHKAVDLSTKTCEICGSEGKPNYGAHWIRTLCDDCATHRDFISGMKAILYSTLLDENSKIIVKEEIQKLEEEFEFKINNKEYQESRLENLALIKKCFGELTI